jgi:hypothetical protein
MLFCEGISGGRCTATITVCFCKTLLQLAHLSLLRERKMLLSIGLSVSFSTVRQREHMYW